jgi:hypothetical protein
MAVIVITASSSTSVKPFGAGRLPFLVELFNIVFNMASASCPLVSVCGDYAAREPMRHVTKISYMAAGQFGTTYAGPRDRSAGATKVAVDSVTGCRLKVAGWPHLQPVAGRPPNASRNSVAAAPLGVLCG